MEENRQADIQLTNRPPLLCLLPLPLCTNRRPGTEITTTRRPRAPGEHRDRPAAGTHRTAATTAANRVRDGTFLHLHVLSSLCRLEETEGGVRGHSVNFTLARWNQGHIYIYIRTIGKLWKANSVFAKQLRDAASNSQRGQRSWPSHLWTLAEQTCYGRVWFVFLVPPWQLFVSCLRPWGRS